MTCNDVLDTEAAFKLFVRSFALAGACVERANLNAQIFVAGGDGGHSDTRRDLYCFPGFSNLREIITFQRSTLHSPLAQF